MKKTENNEKKTTPRAAPPAQTSTARVHAHNDRAASIDAELDAAIDEIDTERKAAAEADIVKWVNTYMIGLLLDEPPPPKGETVLREMWQAITQHGNYLICMPRG